MLLVAAMGVLLYAYVHTLALVTTHTLTLVEHRAVVGCFGRRTPASADASGAVAAIVYLAAPMRPCPRAKIHDEAAAVTVLVAVGSCRTPTQLPLLSIEQWRGASVGGHRLASTLAVR